MDIYETINRMRIERKRIEDIPMRVTFYARVSTMKEEQDSSIEAQVAHFTEMIQKNPNWTYVEGYVDRVRGESVDNRLQFQQMIDDGYAGEFDLILTKEVSRFARNTIDSLTYTRDLLKHGVGVFFLTDNICTIEQDSELRLTIMSSIAQDEVRKLSERIKFGHKKSIESGHVLGNSRIFGYDKVKNRLVINEYEAEMVRLIFETYATGEYGLRYIEDMLWNKGYRNRNGKKIHHNTLSGIIQNPKYKGYYCGNKVKIVDYRTKEQKFLPEDEWIMYKDETGEIVPAIVSEEIWQQANDVFVKRSMVVKATERSAKKTSPLSGKIICGEHDEPFWRTSYSERIHKDCPVYQWLCRTKKRGKYSDCPTIAIYESELYMILGKFVAELAGDIDQYIEALMNSYYDNIKDDKTGTRIKELEREISSIEKKKEKLLDLYTDDVITKTEFKQRNSTLQESIERLQKESSQVEKKAQLTNDVVGNVKRIRDVMKEIASQTSDSHNDDIFSDRNYINDICDLLVDRIIVYAIDKKTMKLEIRLKFGKTYETQYTKRIQSSGIMFLKMMPKHRMGNSFYTPENRQNISSIFLFEVTSNLRKALVNHPPQTINYIIHIAL